MATSMEGTHGHVSLTGYQGEVPSKAGQSFVDFVASWSALLGIGTALHYRNRTGKGQWQDLGMYQAGCFFAGEHILDWTANSRRPTRIGNRHPWRAPQGCYPCSGTDQWCAISVGDDDEWTALCEAMGHPELPDDPRFLTASDRMKHHDELDEIIRGWTETLDKFGVMERLQGVGVPAGPVYDSKDANTDPHYRERGFMQRLDYPAERQMGSRVLMTRSWQLSKAPMPVERAAPKLGEGNQYFLQELLGLGDSEVAKLDEAGIIGDQPPNPAPPNVISLPDQVSRGRVAYFDPDFKAKLGI
jgi:crotonobetainyl-CoA:carnitine CoA-transferase CaiB-like acyl-CoA transferase